MSTALSLISENTSGDVMYVFTFFGKFW